MPGQDGAPPRYDGQIELDHICCCDPARSLCGEHVIGQAVLFGAPELSKNPCQQCFNLAADGALCGEPECPGGEE